MTQCHYCDRPAWYRDRDSQNPLCPLHARLEVAAADRTGARPGAALQIRSSTPADRDAILALWDHFWFQDDMDCFGRLYRAEDLPALLACDREQVAGVLSYAIEPGWDAINIVVLNVLPAYQGRGAAGQLLAELEEMARDLMIGSLIVATSNDNLPALEFYQRLNFQITGIEIDAIEPDRPGEPHIGVSGIPIRDEIQLEKRLRPERI